MNRRQILLSMLMAPLARWMKPSSVFGSSAAVSDPVNGVVFYRQAVGWMKSLSPEQKGLLGRASISVIDDQKLAAFIDQAQPALRALRQGAASTARRWEEVDSPPFDLDQLSLSANYSRLAQVACLSARKHVAQGRGAEALDDLFAGYLLANQIGTSHLPVFRISERCEIDVSKTTGHLLPMFDRATLDDLAKRLDALPAPTLASVRHGQNARYFRAMIAHRLARLGPTINDDQWKDLHIEAELIPALKRLTGGSRARLAVYLAATDPPIAELGRRLDLPHPDCRQALDWFAEEQETIRPIVSTSVSHAWKIRVGVDELLVHRAMVRAGLILVRDGEPAFRAERDPFGTGGFELERRNQGFLIRSAFHNEGYAAACLEVGDVS